MAQLLYRFRHRFAVMAVTMALCLFAVADQAAQLSPSVVLVLKLVAADRVQPISGVVVSGDGHVLVPAAFVEEPAEIVVLDGGTDIVVNGRRARIAWQHAEANLAVLSVEGLDRPAATLAERVTGDVGLFLEAFPPARNIAAGDGPLKSPVTLSGDSDIAPAGTAALPNVTGPVLDECGYLVALNLAEGAQSLEPAAKPATIGLQTLAAALEAYRPGLVREVCIPSVVEQQDETAAVKPLKKTRQVPAEAPQASAVLPVERPSPTTPGTPVEIELAEDEPVEEPATDNPAPPISKYIPWWLRLSGLLILAVLAWRIAVTYRRSHASRAVQPASDEPDTVQLSAAAPEDLRAPRSGRSDAGEAALPTSLPEGCTGLVILEAAAGSRVASRYACPVDLARFDIVIGRGGADLDIDDPAISRRHARLVRNAGVMTLSDLGSSNGSFVDRVPFLPGEIVRVETGTEVCLGETAFLLTLVEPRVETP